MALDRVTIDRKMYELGSKGAFTTTKLRDSVGVEASDRPGRTLIFNRIKAALNEGYLDTVGSARRHRTYVLKKENVLRRKLEAQGAFVTSTARISHPISESSVSERIPDWVKNIKGFSASAREIMERLARIEQMVTDLHAVWINSDNGERPPAEKDA